MGDEVKLEVEMCRARATFMNALRAVAASPCS